MRYPHGLAETWRITWKGPTVNTADRKQPKAAPSHLTVEQLYNLLDCALVSGDVNEDTPIYFEGEALSNFVSYKTEYVFGEQRMCFFADDEQGEYDDE